MKISTISLLETVLIFFGLSKFLLIDQAWAPENFLLESMILRKK